MMDQYVSKVKGAPLIYTADGIQLGKNKLLFSDMTNIAIRDGETPGWTFVCKGRHMLVPYEEAEREFVEPFVRNAMKQPAAALAAAVEPAPAPAAPEPEAAPPAPPADTPPIETAPPQPEKAEKPKKPIYKRVPFYLALAALLIIALIIFGGIGQGGPTDSANVDSSPITEEEIPELYTDAEPFIGRTFEFTGEVLDVEKDGSDLYLQVYQDLENYENNTIVQYPDADISVKENDFVRVSGTIEGSFSGENAFGGEVTAPQIAATKVEKVDVTEAFPAHKTVDVGKTVTKGDYKATVTRVDFTNDAARVYVTVQNNSSATFDNYPEQGVIVQGSQQFEAEWREYYPEANNELKPGVQSECIVVFPGVEESDFTYSFQGYNADYDELEFSFDINVN